MVKLGRSVRAQVKKSVCPKMELPYGESAKFRRDFYNPACHNDLLASCKDICGKRCRKQCKNEHDGDCERGLLTEDSFFCPMRDDAENAANLPFVYYEIVEEANVKEGKNAYKKMDRFYIIILL